MPTNKKPKILITKDGPYLVSGNLPLAKEIIVCDASGDPIKWVKGKKYPDREEYLLCRCGQSKNKPFCDQTHKKIGFNGKLTASQKKYLDQAEKITGPDLVLTDAEELCALARFCHRSGGTWNLTENSDNKDSRKTAIEEACNCPSGRLIAWDKKTKKAIEPKFNKSISLVEDPQKEVSGPIWAKGGIDLESEEGEKYETRNRVTLCRRCGQSKNKPFCDGCHIESGFNDGDKSLGK